MTFRHQNCIISAVWLRFGDHNCIDEFRESKWKKFMVKDQRQSGKSRERASKRGCAFARLQRNTEPRGGFSGPAIGEEAKAIQHRRQSRVDDIKQWRECCFLFRRRAVTIIKNPRNPFANQTPPRPSSSLASKPPQPLREPETTSSMTLRSHDFDPKPPISCNPKSNPAKPPNRATNPT